ncbi:MAG: hypothetical protein P9L99_11295 [Candidatus Lernaella stagnicola]|nr:hypothetical protein [Candidatus Lernaella stagnicola]
MAKCEMCNRDVDTTEVTIADKDSGETTTLQLCRECALKSAVAINAGGGEAHYVEGSKNKTRSSGCMVFLVAITLCGVGTVAVAFSLFT